MIYFKPQEYTFTKSLMSEKNPIGRTLVLLGTIQILLFFSPRGGKIFSDDYTRENGYIVYLIIL